MITVTHKTAKGKALFCLLLVVMIPLGCADTLSVREGGGIDWHSLTPAQAEMLIEEGRLDPKGFYANEAKVEKLMTPIMKVVQNNGDADVIDVLVRHGTDINWHAEEVGSKEEKYTALDYALYRGYVNLTRRLLELGADIHSQDKYNDSPAIFYAAGNPKLDWEVWKKNMDLLLSHGADINAFDYSSLEYNYVYTPLMRAINKEEYEKKDIDLISYMVSRGASINIKPPDGNMTAMHLAVIAKESTVFKTLLRLGGEMLI